MNVILPTASVHGRFQTLHNEHLEYILAASSRCRFLWVGITKYDLETEVSPLGREREKPENNPLTYFERISIIAEALTEKGVGRDTFGFIPFPIEHPQKLKQFLPTSIICFTTICEDWNLEKIKVLQDQGYTVDVLWKRAKEISGRAIREDILADNSRWRELVPPATQRAVERLKLAERLKQLSVAGR